MAVLASLTIWIAIWTTLVHSVPRSSAQLHKQTLDTVMHATYGFFVTTDAGTTLNRFSTDMNLIERDLAGAVLQLLESVAIIVFSAILILAGASYAGAMAHSLLASYT